MNMGRLQPEKMKVGTERDLSATLWQLEVFVAAVDLEDWNLVEQRLGVDRYRCRRAIDRLSERLGTEKLLSRIDDRMIISPKDRELARKARLVLKTYEELRDMSFSTERSVIVRFAAYPAHLKRFAAAAIGDVEHALPNVRVELQDLEGRRRRGGGISSTTQLRDRALDVVIAASNFEESVPHGLAAQDLYGWRLIAIANQDDRLSRYSRRQSTPFVKVDQLKGRRLLVAPKGHRSRDLLDLFANLDPPWEIAGESEDPEVLASLAENTDRVAVVPSDSLAELRDEWPVVVASTHGALGGKYRVHWRNTNSDPERLREAMALLTESLVSRAKGLQQRRGGSLTPTASERRYDDPNFSS
jgi:hypothetical protein